ncbi:MAG: glutamate 5-kinase [Deltaproteobacteria bacterium]|nr:glutamate 5-kinase [Deltaproteobacteria bacterium]
MTSTDPSAWRQRLPGSRRIVVKVGSTLLTTADRSGVDGRMLLSLVTQLAAQRDAGRQVLLVSSGAVALGLGPMGLTERPSDLASMQACAACGQVRLMHHYAEAFGTCRVAVGQVLLTHADLADRRRYLNARRTIAAMLDRGVLPIFNENDTVASDEIKLGDNDTLGAEVVGLSDSDGLILLTDRDGLFTKDPRSNPDAVRVPFVSEVTDEVRAMAGGTAGLGTGGMGTKVSAAHLAGQSGAWTVVAPGRGTDVLARVMAGADVGTLFAASEDKQPARKRWIGGTLRPQGVLVVDAGAERALQRGGSSLLPAGIRAVEGQFESGEPVEIRGPDGTRLARGLSAYGSEEIQRIAGKKTHEIQAILGYKYADEVIHRDDMVLG